MGVAPAIWVEPAKLAIPHGLRLPKQGLEAELGSEGRRGEEGEEKAASLHAVVGRGDEGEDEAVSFEATAIFFQLDEAPSPV